MPIHDTFFPLVSFVIYVLLYIVYLQGEGVRQRRRRERPDAGYGLRYLVARLVKVIHPRNRNRVPAPRNFEM